MPGQRLVGPGMALMAGPRRGEMCALQWKHVDFVQDVIRVQRSPSRIDGLKSPKSRVGLRDVPMPPQLMEVLVALHTAQGQPAEGFVLRT